MPSASVALQQSLFAALTGDPALLALLGGPRVFDDVPHHQAFPFVTLGQATVRDWSTGSEAGDEHTLTLHVWSRGTGRSETHAILRALRDAVHDRALAVAGHRLVNLRHEFSEARRDADGQTYHGILRLRAITEPIS